ncbi:MAG TPA: GSCFA domain-containing protein [Flavobacterium sp.]|jgi:hypothetical protein
MQFSTKVPIHKASCGISYNSEIFSLGSCFAVNISEKFSYYRFRNVVNPFGILFHPVAISNFLKDVSSKRLFVADDLIFHNETWNCFDAHSEISNSSKDDLLANLNQASKAAYDNIQKASHVIITLGTSWVYKHLASDAIVANCHKVPQKAFQKELLSVETISSSIGEMISIILGLNPQANIIFTISPVRHLKDGFVENQISKANLISALHKTINRQLTTVNYFPSYEIMMDELRDYRFYNADMIHPNQIAIDYIWERFSEAYLSPEALEIAAKVDDIQKALNHRPFNSNSAAHQQFQTNLQSKIENLQEQYPHITFQNT